MRRIAWLAVVLSVCVAVPAGAQSIVEIPLTTNDLVYDPVSARLYASVPGIAGINGNSVAVINPATATVERYVPVGSEPAALAVSGNGQYLYVGLTGENAIQRLLLPSLASDIKFGVSDYPTLPLNAGGIVVQPNNPGTIAVRRYSSSADWFGTIAIYDDDVKRPVVSSREVTGLAFSEDGTRLFGTYIHLMEFEVTPSGVGPASYHLEMASRPRLVSIGGRLWGRMGEVVDPAAEARVALFDVQRTPGDFVPDPAADRAYFLFPGYKNGEWGPATIRAYSISTQRLAWVLEVAETVDGVTGSLVRWGPSGLAFRSDGSIHRAVFIVSLDDARPLTVDKAGLGNGTVSSRPRGISCGDTCASLFPAGSQVTLEAVPDAGSVFLGWEGDSDCADGVVAMAAARTCAAVYAPKSIGMLRAVPMRTNDLEYSAYLDRLVASVPGSDPIRGNTITVIDPLTGEIGPSVWVGSEPGPVALSDDGTVLYVGLVGTGAVRRVDLTTMTARPIFTLGVVPNLGTVLVPGDLAVFPGSADTVAVTRVKDESSDRCFDLAVYDNGVMRPLSASLRQPDWIPSSYPNTNTRLAFSDTGTLLYGHGSWSFFVMQVDSEGARQVSVGGAGYVQPIDYHNGLLFYQQGRVVDKQGYGRSRELETASPTAFALEPARELVHYVASPSGVRHLRSYSTIDFTLRRSTRLPWVSSKPSMLVPAGQDRMAFRIGSSEVGLLYLDPNLGSQDVNGDGSPDIVWHNRLTGEVLVWNMVGGVRTGTTSVVGCADVNWRLVARADFNSDGKPDFLWRHAVSGLNEIWFMDGATRLGGASLQTVPDPAWRVAGAADFNGDTRPDILWRNTQTGENVLWYMNGAQRIGNDTLTPIDVGWHIGGVADFNGDGRPDLVLRNERTGENVVWYMNGVVRAGYERLKNAPAGWSIGDVIDFNLDGHPDLLWRNGATGQNVVWYLNGAAHVSSQVLPDADAAWSVLQGPPGQSAVASNDFNEDGKPDLLWHNEVTGENVLWLMSGAVVTGKPRLPTVTDVNWRPVSVGDFNADGKADILWRHTSTGENVVWHMDGATHLGNQRLATVADAAWEVAGAADFNRDGWADIVWRNAATGENVVWLMTGAQCTQHVRLKGVADANWVVAATADFTGDGKPDLLWRNQATGENIVWHMDGATYAGYARVRTVADAAWQIVMAADFDLDGKSDIAWRTQTTGENIVWHMNGTAYVGYERLATVSDTDWQVVR